MERDKRIVGIIMAAGSGSRMKSDIPKQLMVLAGKPMLMHSVELFAANSGIDRVVVTASEDSIEETKRMVGGSDRVNVVLGGASRHESLYKALLWVRENVTEGAYVISHDAARPFLKAEVLAAHVAMASSGEACTTAFPAVDTIALSADGVTVDEVPERSCCWSVQTPQSFDAEEYLELYEALAEEQRSALTDAAGLYMMCGRHVRIVMGDSGNRKISYMEDMDPER